MQNGQQPSFPPIATWRVNVIRLVFLLMAGFMGSFVWYRLIFESADIPVQQFPHHPRAQPPAFHKPLPRLPTSQSPHTRT